MSFTSGDAFLDELKICPTTLVAEVMFSLFKLLILDVKIWTSLETIEIIEEFSDELFICLKKKANLTFYNYIKTFQATTNE